jgi:hypothetical protein
MRTFLAILVGLMMAGAARAQATFVQTPYAPPG